MYKKICFVAISFLFICSFSFAAEMDDVETDPAVKNNQQILKMIRAFGAGAVPIITVGEAIVCIGQTKINEILSAIKSKL